MVRARKPGELIFEVDGESTQNPVFFLQICHSKSGEINPVKVANLVKAYVDKYRHMRRHKKTEGGEEPPTQGVET